MDWGNCAGGKYDQGEQNTKRSFQNLSSLFCFVEKRNENFDTSAPASTNNKGKIAFIIIGTAHCALDVQHTLICRQKIYAFTAQVSRRQVEAIIYHLEKNGHSFNSWTFIPSFRFQ